ncbi:electron carrier/ protein disulfide oxidoreductase [Anaeramoeba ignava]|uniref:Electron carrier/ protein disulfide oxidoreductase n=1 Tax=Anaeramoeba ignava TaxID=1746090 RepID=A0A9Q0R806_ANAIG|nr:electron carrier/ protein disulfide oxidoreductase [Anaeramoeba ignava]
MNQEQKQEVINKLKNKIAKLQQEKEKEILKRKKKQNLEKKLLKTQERLKDITFNNNRLRSELKTLQKRSTDFRSITNESTIQESQKTLLEYNKKIKNITESINKLKEMHSKLQSVNQQSQSSKEFQDSEKELEQIIKETQNLIEKIAQIRGKFSIKNLNEKNLTEKNSNQKNSNQKNPDNTLLLLNVLFSLKNELILLKAKNNQIQDSSSFPIAKTMHERSSEELITKLRNKIKEVIDQNQRLVTQLNENQAIKSQDTLTVTAEEYTETMNETSEFDYADFSENDDLEIVLDEILYFPKNRRKSPTKNFQKSFSPKKRSSLHSQKVLQTNVKESDKKEVSFVLNEDEFETVLLKEQKSENDQTKKEIDKNTNSQKDLEEKNKRFSIETFEEIFQVPLAVDFFKEFLCEQMNQENILFYLDILELETMEPDSIQLRKKAIYIIEKYIKTGSVFEINIDSKNRSRILEKSKNGNYSPQIFTEAKEIVFRHMDHDNFSEFKKSHLYADLLSRISDLDTRIRSKDIKRAKIITISVENLNSSFEFRGNPRSATIISQELSQKVIDLCNCFFFGSTNQIDFSILASSIPFRRFANSTTELQKVELKNLFLEEKLAFFINIYNVLCFHSAIVKGIPEDKNSLKEFMKTSIYQISGQLYSLHDIKYGILRGNLYQKSKYFKSGDPRIENIVFPSDPRFYFALISLDLYSSILHVYSPEKIDEDLTQIAQGYLLLHTRVLTKKSPRILIPKTLHDIFQDFGKIQPQFLKWLCTFIPPKMAQQIKDSPSPFLVKFKPQFTSPLIIFENFFWKIHKSNQIKKPKIKNENNLKTKKIQFENENANNENNENNANFSNFSNN